MANLAGFGSAAVGNMINHYTRHHGDPEQTKYTYRNQNIDPTRTHLNYTIGDARQDPMAFVREMIARSDVPPRNGARATNVISDWIITIPKNELLAGREREFFQTAYEYLKDKVGEDRIIGAYIHMDEGMPHMHFAFVPLVATPVMTNDKTRPLRDKDGNIKHDSKGTIRYERVPKLDEDGNKIMRTSLAQSKMFPRSAMREFHPELEKAMEKHFGFEVGIQLKEDQVIEKALSNVPQQAMDATREGLEKELVAPAQAKADRIVEVAKQDAKGWQDAAEQAKEECREEIAKAEVEHAKAAQAQTAAQQAAQAAVQAQAVEQQAKQATEVAKGELAQVQQETAQTQDRLECLRRGETEQRAAIAELDRAIGVKEQELAAPAVDAGDDRQETGQEQQQEQGQERADEQGRSIGEQGAGLVRELAETAQRASQGDGRSLAELGDARSAAESRVGELEQRVGELESQRDAAAERVAELESAQERREQECREAESQEQKAGERLQTAESRIGELRERFVERVTQLREQLGLKRAGEIVRDVRDRVCQGREMLREMLGDKAADRVNDALEAGRQQQEPQQEYSARDWARYEQDRGMER